MLAIRPPGVLHQDTLWSRTIAPADLEPPKRLGLGKGIEAWSRIGLGRRAVSRMTKNNHEKVIIICPCGIEEEAISWRRARLR